MRLISLKSDDPEAGWRLEEMQFFPDITLLVGLSGVGKTRILDTIKRLQRIATGKASGDNWGRSWEIKFREAEREYIWSGEFEGRKNEIPERFTGMFSVSDEELQPIPKIVREALERDGHIVVQRAGERITLNGAETPKLSQEESILHILRNEESIADAHRGMDSILHVDHVENPTGMRFTVLRRKNWESMRQKLETIEAIRREDIPTRLKLALAFENCPGVFADIASQFKDAFPYVEDVKVEYVDIGGPFGKTPRVVLQEAGVDKAIPEESISSGMLRTLMHLSRMALWPDGTVVLIDEFENSLGINCIDFVTQDLLVHSRRLQFVLTSHHPYIINNVEMRNWKIVSRNGRSVFVQDSSLLGSSSRHEAFLQLLNAPEYAEGIALK